MTRARSPPLSASAPAPRAQIVVTLPVKCLVIFRSNFRRKCSCYSRSCFSLPRAEGAASSLGGGRAEEGRGGSEPPFFLPGDNGGGLSTLSCLPCSSLLSSGALCPFSLWKGLELTFSRSGDQDSATSPTPVFYFSISSPLNVACFSLSRPSILDHPDSTADRPSEGLAAPTQFRLRFLPSEPLPRS